MTRYATAWWEDETARVLAVRGEPGFIVDRAGRVAFANAAGLRQLRVASLDRLGRRYVPSRYVGLIAKARELDAAASVRHENAEARRLPGRERNVRLDLDGRSARPSLGEVAERLLASRAWALREGGRVRTNTMDDDAAAAMTAALEAAGHGATGKSGTTYVGGLPVVTLDWNRDRLVWVGATAERLTQTLASLRDAQEAFAPAEEETREDAAKTENEAETDGPAHEAAGGHQTPAPVVRGDASDGAPSGSPIAPFPISAAAPVPIEGRWRTDEAGTFTAGPASLAGRSLVDALRSGFDPSGAFAAGLETRRAFETLVDGWPARDGDGDGDGGRDGNDGDAAGVTARALVRGRPVFRTDGLYRGMKGEAVRATVTVEETLSGRRNDSPSDGDGRSPADQGFDIPSARRDDEENDGGAERGDGVPLEPDAPSEASGGAPLALVGPDDDVSRADVSRDSVSRASISRADASDANVSDADVDADLVDVLTAVFEAAPDTDLPSVGGATGTTPLEGARLSDAALSDAALSNDEQDAFHQIARLLKDGPVGLDSRRREGFVALDAPGAPDAPVGPVPGGTVSPDAAGAPLHAVLDAVPLATVVYREDSILAVNKAARRLLGYEGPDGLTGAGGVGALFAEEPRSEDTPRRLAPTRRLRRADGETLDLIVSLRSMRWSDGTAFLLTMREPDAGAAIGADRDDTGETILSDDVLQGLPVGVVALNGDGTVLTANDSALSLLGRPRREVWETSFLDLLCEASRRDVLGDLHAALRGEAPPARRVIGLGPLEDDGETPRLDLRLQRYRSQGGDRIVATLLDAASRAELERVADRAEAAQDAMRRERAHFVRRVSHEIRTPLNAIVGFSEVMLEERFGPLGNPRYRDYAQDIREGGRRIITLVGDLMDLMRLQEDEIVTARETIGLNELVSSAVARLHNEAGERRIIMRCSLARDVAPVLGDRNSVMQVVSNLLEHTLRHAKPGDQVIVSTTNTAEGGVAVKVRGASETDEAVLKGVFAPFASEIDTAAPDGETPDFALPLARALAEANGADLSIESAEGRGTLTQVLFPAERVAAA